MEVNVVLTLNASQSAFAPSHPILLSVQLLCVWFHMICFFQCCLLINFSAWRDVFFSSPSLRAITPSSPRLFSMKRVWISFHSWKLSSITNTVQINGLQCGVDLECFTECLCSITSNSIACHALVLQLFSHPFHLFSYNADWVMSKWCCSSETLQNLLHHHLQVHILFNVHYCHRTSLKRSIVLRWTLKSVTVVFLCNQSVSAAVTIVLFRCCPINCTITYLPLSWL